MKYLEIFVISNSLSRSEELVKDSIRKLAKISSSWSSMYRYIDLCDGRTINFTPDLPQYIRGKRGMFITESEFNTWLEKYKETGEFGPEE